MKAIVCFADGNIHLNSFSSEWTPCACGNVRVKWIDPTAGTVVVAAMDRERVRLLGLNNSYLVGAINFRGGDLPWADYRSLHESSTDAPGYIFDKSRGACWAMVVSIGRSNDVRWATDEEYEEAFKK